MIKNRRRRIKLVRQALESMPRSGIERMVSLRYMHDFTELDIREDLCITKRVLSDAKVRIKTILVEVGIEVSYEDGK